LFAVKIVVARGGIIAYRSVAGWEGGGEGGGKPMLRTRRVNARKHTVSIVSIVIEIVCERSADVMLDALAR
jgi:hypothetical protein